MFSLEYSGKKLTDRVTLRLFVIAYIIGHWIAVYIRS